VGVESALRELELLDCSGEVREVLDLVERYLDDSRRFPLVYIPIPANGKTFFKC
jgi:hypothetical protein